MAVARERIETSMGSCVASSATPAASWTSRVLVSPGLGSRAVTSSRFCVKVPVLSEKRVVMVAASSTAASPVTRMSAWASSVAPTALARVKVAGRATGMETTRRTSAKGIRVSQPMPRRRATPATRTRRMEA